MTSLVIPRRRFLAGLVGLVAAPMVVRAAALMPTKGFDIVDVEFTTPGFIHATERIINPGPLGFPGEEMVISVFKEDIKFGSFGWPNSVIGFVRHRRDLADLGEPYLSKIKAQRENLVRQS